MTRLLCTAHGCPRCWEEGYAGGLRQKLPPSNPLDRRAVEILRTVLADDCYAMTFQTMGQYRKALIRYLDRGDK